MFEISAAPIDPQRLAAAMCDDEAGALATFEGWVRRHNDGREVERLEYEAYADMAVNEGQRILDEALARFDILGATCVHRVGLLDIGDKAVWVGACAAHRSDALQACHYMIEAVKSRVPIWKKEHYRTGEATWVNCQQPVRADRP